MKKFLALAAVVCMATFAQALQINWTSTNLPIDTGITASLVYCSGTDTKSVLEVYTDATGYTTTAVDFVIDGLVQSGVDMGYIEWNTVSAPTGTSTYYVFLTTATGAAWGAEFEATDGLWGEVKGQPPTAGTVALSFEKVAVPEPTVLALLALGVAGMALRRKVA